MGCYQIVGNLFETPAIGYDRLDQRHNGRRSFGNLDVEFVLLEAPARTALQKIF